MSVLDHSEEFLAMHTTRGWCIARAMSGTSTGYLGPPFASSDPGIAKRADANALDRVPSTNRAVKVFDFGA